MLKPKHLMHKEGVLVSGMYANAQSLTSKVKGGAHLGAPVSMRLL